MMVEILIYLLFGRRVFLSRDGGKGGDIIEKRYHGLFSGSFHGMVGETSELVCM